MASSLNAATMTGPGMKICLSVYLIYIYIYIYIYISCEFIVAFKSINIKKTNLLKLFFVREFNGFVKLIQIFRKPI